MIAREISEDRHVILHSVHTRLRQRVRRNFHHRFGRAFAHTFVEDAIQIK